MSRPFVSVITPTYNRRRFLPSLIECYKSQTYPKDRMEWIILDDGEDCVEDIFKEAAKKIPNLRYIRREPKLLIGAKRNILNKEAKGEIIVAMTMMTSIVLSVLLMLSSNSPSSRRLSSQDLQRSTCFLRITRLFTNLALTIRIMQQMARWHGGSLMR